MLTNLPFQSPALVRGFLFEQTRLATVAHAIEGYPGTEDYDRPTRSAR